MSLFKRGDVYWSYVWQDGIRYARSTGTDKIRKAESDDRKHKEELELKKFRPKGLNPEMEFGELFARFLAGGDVKPFHVERSTMFLPYFADKPLKDITKNEIIRYRKERHKAKKLTETTLNRDVEVIRHVLFWAVEEGILPANPLARSKLSRARRIKRPILSIQEEHKLLEAAAPHLKQIIICALDSGLRRSEILSQRFEDLDFSRQVLVVSKSKTPEGEARELPLTNRLFELLKELRNKNAKGEVLIFTFGGDAVKSIKTSWRTAIRKAGIRSFRFKDLRTTFNSRLIEAGVLKDIRKELMGHSRNEDVNDLYSQIELPTLRAAIRKLEAWKDAQEQTQNQTTKTEGINRSTIDAPENRKEAPQNGEQPEAGSAV